MMRQRSETLDLIQLRKLLNPLARKYDLRHLSPDPIEIVHEYALPQDQEVVALIAASLAYGNVQTILASIRNALTPLGHAPADFLANLHPSKAFDLLPGFRHRFNNGADMAMLFCVIGEALRMHGSLENTFLPHYSPAHHDVAAALDGFINSLLEVQPRRYLKKSTSIAPRNFPFLLSRPSSGSACKRMNLFLRWMVRPNDGVDFGLWEKIPPSKLIIPLDTHVLRIAQYLGLTRRNQADLKTAREISDFLRQLDPNDPVRYDFAISRLGILGICRRNQAQCGQCGLNAVCHRKLGNNGKAKSV